MPPISSQHATASLLPQWPQARPQAQWPQARPLAGSAHRPSVDGPSTTARTWLQALDGRSCRCSVVASCVHVNCHSVQSINTAAVCMHILSLREECCATTCCTQQLLQPWRLQSSQPTHGQAKDYRRHFSNGNAAVQGSAEVELKGRMLCTREGMGRWLRGVGGQALLNAGKYVRRVGSVAQP